MPRIGQGTKNLMKLVSIGQVEGFYYKPRIDKQDLRKYHEGLICLSACVAGGSGPATSCGGEKERRKRSCLSTFDIFGRDHYYLEIQNHGLPEERLWPTNSITWPANIT